MLTLPDKIIAVLAQFAPLFSRRVFSSAQVLLIGGEGTLERRQGAQIAKKGIYKDSARSSKRFFVKSSGLRWIVFMVLVPIPWAQRTWALPFFAVLAPSERCHQERKKRHKTLSVSFPSGGRPGTTDVGAGAPFRALIYLAASQQEDGNFAQNSWVDGTPYWKGVQLQEN